jgi:hypothetical protein
MMTICNSIILLVSTALVIGGCSTCLPVPPLYVQGQAAVQVTKHGTLVRGTALEADTTIVFEKVGQSAVVYSDESFILSIPNTIDMALYALQIKESDALTAGQKSFELTLVESCMPSITIDKHCKIVNWYNPYRIPEIRVSNSETDQLILTPLISGDNTIVGYEVRLGVHGRNAGCPSPALDALQRLRDKNTTIMRASSNNRKTPRNPEFFAGFPEIRK